MKQHLTFLIIFSFFITINTVHAFSGSMSDRLAGRILLQVESNGEAWYVNPKTKLRHYMGRPSNAFELMRAQGVGVSNNNLEKIPIGLANLTGADSDKDGLPDAFEDAIGTNKNNSDTDNDGFNDKEELEKNYNPSGNKKLVTDLSFTNKQKGKIFLQVEAHGEAWYVNPVDNKRYFLGRPHDAFNIMRGLGLGVANQDINIITVGVNNEKVADALKMLCQIGDEYSSLEEHNIEKFVGSINDLCDKFDNLKKKGDYVYIVKEIERLNIKSKNILEKTKASFRDSKRISDIQSIRSSLLLYYMNNNKKYPDSLNQLLTAGIIGASGIPSNPTPGGSGYIYTPSQYRQHYTLTYTLETNKGVYKKGFHTASKKGLVSSDEEKIKQIEVKVEDELEIALDNPLDRDKKRVSDVKQIQSNLELYYNDFNEYPARLSLLSLNERGIIYYSKIPTDPNTGSEYNYILEELNKKQYKLEFALEVGYDNFLAGLHSATERGIQ